MKIAFSADTHLTTRSAHPGRYAALENILDQLVENQISTLVLAGDIFDKDQHHFADFERLLGKKKYEAIRLLAIPGNHDRGLKNSDVVAKNVTILSEPELVVPEGSGLPILLIPFSDKRTMGECLEAFSEQLKPNQWILVGHGDWAGNLQRANAYEGGIYMPLTASDLQRYRPRLAFLGHTHTGGTAGNVHQLQSPYPLNINETGRRFFMVLDTQTEDIEKKPVDTDIIYFNDLIVMLPTEDEKAYLLDAVQRMQTGWSIDAAQLSKVELRLRVAGYCRDREAVRKNLEAALKEITLYNDEEIDLSQLSIAEDVERQSIADGVRQRIAELERPAGDDEPEHEDILLDALAVIYGGAK